MTTQALTITNQPTSIYSMNEDFESPAVSDTVRDRGWRMISNFSVHTSAFMAVAAITTFSGSHQIPTWLDPSISGSALREQDHTVEPVHQHMLDSYEEMQGYGNLSDGWDGDGSIAPSSQTIFSALQFLVNLPAQISPPEAGSTADGDAEWYWKSSNGIATVSFHGNRMAYFAKSGDSTNQDAIDFDGKSVPKSLLDILLVI